MAGLAVGDLLRRPLFLRAADRVRVAGLDSKISELQGQRNIALVVAVLAGLIALILLIIKLAT